MQIMSAENSQRLPSHNKPKPETAAAIFKNILNPSFCGNILDDINKAAKQPSKSESARASVPAINRVGLAGRTFPDRFVVSNMNKPIRATTARNAANETQQSNDDRVVRESRNNKIPGQRM